MLPNAQVTRCLEFVSQLKVHKQTLVSKHFLITIFIVGEKTEKILGKFHDTHCPATDEQHRFCASCTVVLFLPYTKHKSTFVLIDLYATV